MTKADAVIVDGVKTMNVAPNNIGLYRYAIQIVKDQDIKSKEFVLTMLETALETEYLIENFTKQVEHKLAKVEHGNTD